MDVKNGKPRDDAVKLAFAQVFANLQKVSAYVSDILREVSASGELRCRAVERVLELNCKDLLCQENGGSIKGRPKDDK